MAMPRHGQSLFQPRGMGLCVFQMSLYGDVAPADGKDVASLAVRIPSLHAHADLDRFTAGNRAEVHSNIHFIRSKSVAPFVNGPMIQMMTLNEGAWQIVGQYNGPVGRRNTCGIIGNSCCSGLRSGGFGPPVQISFCNGNAVCGANNTCFAAPPPPACGGH